jgi:hypothetical protein
MMTNLQCVTNVLLRHREARGWSDEAVALDLLMQLGLDFAGEAAHAVAVADPAQVTEAEVVAAETAAKEAAEKAAVARAALRAQQEAEAKAKADAAADQAKAATEAREAKSQKQPDPPLARAHPIGRADTAPVRRG